MNYIFVHQSSDLYGSDRSFLSVVEGLLKKGEDDHVTVILPDLNGPLAVKLIETGVCVKVDSNGYLRKIFLKNPFKLVLNIIKSFFKIKKESASFDVLYINTVVCVGAILAARFHKKSIVHVREIPVGYSLVVFRSILKFSQSRIIYNSTATKEAFLLPGDVVYNGVQAPLLPIQTKLKNPIDVKRFLILGRISEWKGQEFVLNAIRDIGETFELYIVGGIAPGREDYYEKLRCIANNISNIRIVFVDFVQNPIDYILKCDFVVVPSLLPEPFGRVAIEAMAYGKIPIVANHGGLKEIVRGCDYGLTFEPGNRTDFITVIKKALSISQDEYLNRTSRCKSVFSAEFDISKYQERMNEILGL